MSGCWGRKVTLLVTATVFALVAPAYSESLSAECSRQLQDVTERASTLEPAALAQLDAWSKIPAGILRGNLRWLGDYDECVHTAGGRYCLAQLRPSASDDQDQQLRTLLDEATSGRSEVEDLSVEPSFAMYRTSLWQLALCVPLACSPSDAAILLTSVVNTSNPLGDRLQLDVNVSSGDCSIGGPPSLTTAASVALIVAAVGVVVLIISTVYSLIQAKQKTLEKGVVQRLAEALSLERGCRQLVKSTPPADAIHCLEGLRVISTVWVIILHHMILLGLTPLANKAELHKLTGNILCMFFVNGISSVDTFFLISGLLRSRSILKELDKGKFSYIGSFTHRYIRLTGAYAVVVAFYSLLFPLVGTGPMWNSAVGLHCRWCQRNWYLSLLYVNNYFHTDQACVAQSWYLSVDMQLFLAAPLVVLALRRWRRAGPAILALLLLVSVLLPAATVAFYNRPAIVGSHTRDVDIISYARDVYFPTHNRMSSYIVGIGLGYILYKGYWTKVSKVTATLCWGASITTMLLVVVGPVRLWWSDGRPDPIEAAVYAGLHSAAWAGAIAWIVFACHNGTAGPVARFLGWSFFQCWGRLCYCFYLTHVAVLLYEAGTMRAAPSIDEYRMFHQLFGNLVVTGALSVGLFVLVETPSAALSRPLTIFTRKTRSDTTAPQQSSAGPA